MGHIARQMKRDAQIPGSDLIPVVVSDIGHPEKSCCGILPIKDKPLECRVKARPAQIARLSSFDYEPGYDLDREIQLIAIVATAPSNVRPAEVLQIGHHADGVVYAFEKHRFARPWPFPGEDLVGLAVEFREPDTGSRPEAAIRILRQPARRVGTVERRLQTAERGHDRIDIRGATNPVIKFVKCGPGIACIVAAPFALRQPLFSICHRVLRVVEQLLGVVAK